MMPPVVWSSLRTAHGDASHVPAALVDLLQGDAESRKAAYWRLDNHVVLQGDLYEAAPFVAAYLVDALREGLQADRRLLVYRLLYEIYNGFADESHIVRVGAYSGNLREVSRRLISEDLALFSRDVVAPDSHLRKEAIDLLVSCDEKAGAVRQILIEAASLSGDDAIERDVARGLRDLDE